MRDDERQQLKIGLLSQWKLEAELHKNKSTYILQFNSDFAHSPPLHVLTNAWNSVQTACPVSPHVQ